MRIFLLMAMLLSVITGAQADQVYDAERVSSKEIVASLLSKDYIYRDFRLKGAPLKSLKSRYKTNKRALSESLRKSAAIKFHDEVALGIMFEEWLGACDTSASQEEIAYFMTWWHASIEGVIADLKDWQNDEYGRLPQQIGENFLTQNAITTKNKSARLFATSRIVNWKLNSCLQKAKASRDIISPWSQARAFIEKTRVQSKDYPPGMSMIDPEDYYKMAGVIVSRDEQEGSSPPIRRMQSTEIFPSNDFQIIFMRKIYAELLEGENVYRGRLISISFGVTDDFIVPLSENDLEAIGAKVKLIDDLQANGHLRWHFEDYREGFMTKYAFPEKARVSDAIYDNAFVNPYWVQ